LLISIFCVSYTLLIHRWTLFHKASLHNCIECGIRIIESVARVSKDQEYGGPNQVLEYLNKTTSNGSTPLMISNRWKESEFSKMLNKQKLTYELLAKKEQKEQKEKQDAYDEEMRQYENNNGNYSDDEDDEYDEYDHNHGEKDKNKENGKLNFAPIQAEFDVNAPYGERTEQWYCFSDIYLLISCIFFCDFCLLLLLLLLRSIRYSLRRSLSDSFSLFIFLGLV